jgi:Uncharacterized protein conserved in bacteria (DUF2188)
MAENSVLNVYGSDATGWQVQRRGDAHPLSRHDTRDDAVAEAKRVAELEAPSEIRVEGADGVVRVEYAYDEDRQLVVGPG